MSLAAMNWRYVGSSAFGSATCPAVLDAIWAVLQAATYPVDAVILTATSGMNIPATGTATFMKTRSGRYGRAPVFVRATAAAPNDTFLGRLRNLVIFTRATTPQYIPSVGYVVSTSNSSASDCLFAEHG